MSIDTVRFLLVQIWGNTSNTRTTAYGYFCMQNAVDVDSMHRKKTSHKETLEKSGKIVATP